MWLLWGKNLYFWRGESVFICLMFHSIGTFTTLINWNILCQVKAGVSNTRPAENFSLQMWPLDGFEFETPGLKWIPEPGASNWNWLEGHITKIKCSAVRNLMIQGLFGPKLQAFKNELIVGQKLYFFHFFELFAGRLFETPDLREVLKMQFFITSYSNNTSGFSDFH
jgi:hypothetical protein